MEFIGLVLPKDDKAIYRSIATAAESGEVESPKKHAQVKLYPAKISVDKAGYNEPEDIQEVFNPITKEEISKLANKLRNGLREFGRFQVKVEGNIAEVGVSSRAVRKVAKKGDKSADTAKTPAPVKKAKA